MVVLPNRFCVLDVFSIMTHGLAERNCKNRFIVVLNLSYKVKGELEEL